MLKRTNMLLSQQKKSKTSDPALSDESGNKTLKPRTINVKSPKHAHHY